MGKAASARRQSGEKRVTIGKRSKWARALLAAVLAVTAVPGGWAAPPAKADTVDDVRRRGVLICGIGEIAGLARRNAEGRYEGFRADVCRAIAAVVLKDPEAVDFVPLVAAARFDALARREVDVVVAGATWTLGRDAGLPVAFTGVHFYDGQGFIAHRRTGWQRLADVTRARVCVVAETTSAANLKGFADATGKTLEPVERVTREGTWEAFLSNSCDLMTHDLIGMATELSERAPDAADYVVFPDLISREPLSPVVRDDDRRWETIVRFTVNALILAEALGMDAAAAAAGGGRAVADDAEARWLLGLEPGIGNLVGLDDGWAGRAIAAAGHYGEIFERNLGADSRFGVARGLNALWRDGGLLYPLPMR